jgi:hypothetical protein
MSWKCPECGAAVPSDTGRCLCGYDERKAAELVGARTAGRGKASAMDRMGKPREIGELLSGKNIRLFIGLAFLALLILFPKHPVGFSFQQSGGRATVAAGSAPWALLLGAIAVSAFIIMMKRPQPMASEKPAGLLRRFGAFAIDFSLLITTFGSLSGLLLVYIEYRRTGSFVWFFQRDYVLPMDTELGFVLLFLTLVPMVLYLAYPPTRGRQTIGDRKSVV